MHHFILRITFGGLLPLLLICIGIVFIYYGKKAKRSRTILEKQCTSTTIGIIIKLEREEVDHEVNRFQQSYLWVPFVQFQVNNLTYKKRLNAYKSDYFKINDKILIYYNPLNPNQFYTPKDQGEQTIFHYFLPAGSALIVLGILEIIIIQVILSIL